MDDAAADAFEAAAAGAAAAVDVVVAVVVAAEWLGELAGIRRLVR